jgi:hypothetical protein
LEPKAIDWYGILVILDGTMRQRVLPASSRMTFSTGTMGIMTLSSPTTPTWKASLFPQARRSLLAQTLVELVEVLKRPLFRVDDSYEPLWCSEVVGFLFLRPLHKLPYLVTNACIGNIHLSLSFDLP